ncbi:MAG TPA: hypothetical protein VKU38_07065 [Ktedonobacteraceae bacterium]|nr:hypothetical protein [Ktedonobacteraceae bacterium]
MGNSYGNGDSTSLSLVSLGVLKQAPTRLRALLIRARRRGVGSRRSV